MTSSARLLRRLSLLGSFALTLALAGCGVGIVSTESATTSLAMTGRVHGGVQPITGATLQLFAVGTGGNGSQALGLLRNPVVTDNHGYFTLTGDYSCPTANSQVYLVARGGNPGFPSNVNNHALVLLSALGNCGNLISDPNRFIQLNEVSTVAAVYALAQFIGGYDRIGGSATNVAGMTNAFLDAQLLADTSTGMAAALPSNLQIEAGKLYAMADVIVPCVNSDGGSACAPLFAAATPSSGPAPTDVLGALLNIVKNPGRNVAAVYNTIGSTPPYPTTLTSAPHDWTMSLTVTGGGLNSPTAMGVDGSGNVWVTNYGDPAPTSGVVAFSPQGTPFPGSPFGAGVQKEAYGLALDKNGDIWVTSKEGHSSGGGTGSFAKFHGANSANVGTLVGTFADGTISYPQSIATDPNGNGEVIVGNYVTGTASLYDLNGVYQTSLGQGFPSFPVGVVSDNAGGVWFADQGDNNIAHARADGTVQVIACCDAAQTVALDLQGNVWVTNFVGTFGAYSFSEVAPNGVVRINQQSGGGLMAPSGGIVDASGQFWIANHAGNSLTEIAGNNASVPAGTALSPTGYGQDAGLFQPFSITLDASGNVWVSNQAANTLSMFFGLATPTATPATPIPQAP